MKDYRFLRDEMIFLYINYDFGISVFFFIFILEIASFELDIWQVLREALEHSFRFFSFYKF